MYAVRDGLTANYRKRAAFEDYLGGKALHLVFELVVEPEFASEVEFEPRALWAQALSVASVSEQAAYTALPITRKSGASGESSF